jgi:hypothetical protein
MPKGWKYFILTYWIHKIFHFKKSNRIHTCIKNSQDLRFKGKGCVIFINLAPKTIFLILRGISGLVDVFGELTIFCGKVRHRTEWEADRNQWTWTRRKMIKIHLRSYSLRFIQEFADKRCSLGTRKHSFWRKVRFPVPFQNPLFPQSIFFLKCST